MEKPVVSCLCLCLCACDLCCSIAKISPTCTREDYRRRLKKCPHFPLKFHLSINLSIHPSIFDEPVYPQGIQRYPYTVHRKFIQPSIYRPSPESMNTPISRYPFPNLYLSSRLPPTTHRNTLPKPSATRPESALRIHPHLNRRWILPLHCNSFRLSSATRRGPLKRHLHPLYLTRRGFFSWFSHPPHTCPAAFIFLGR